MQHSLKGGFAGKLKKATFATAQRESDRLGLQHFSKLAALSQNGTPFRLRKSAGVKDPVGLVHCNRRLGTIREINANLMAVQIKADR